MRLLDALAWVRLLVQFFAVFFFFVGLGLALLAVAILLARSRSRRNFPPYKTRIPATGKGHPVDIPSPQSSQLTLER